MKTFLIATLAALSFSSCVHLNSVSQTQIPANRTNRVEAEADRWIIFFFNFDNDYVDRVSDRLRKECPGGRITGILTKDERTNYFIGLVMKRRVSAAGYCEKGGREEASL